MEERTHNLGMCRDHESSPQPLGVQGNVPPTEPPSQGKILKLYVPKNGLLIVPFIHSNEFLPSLPIIHRDA